jgi:hypothetical protein
MVLRRILEAAVEPRCCRATRPRVSSPPLSLDVICASLNGLRWPPWPTRWNRGALVLLGCYCGLRWGELEGRRRNRVDLLGRPVPVMEQVQELDDGTLSWEPPTSSAGRRAVPMPAFVAEALQRASLAILGAQSGRSRLHRPWRRGAPELPVPTPLLAADNPGDRPRRTAIPRHAPHRPSPLPPAPIPRHCKSASATAQ